MTQPWAGAYDAGVDAELRSPFADALASFEAAVASSPDSPSIIVDDEVLTFADVDRAASMLAADLAERGVGAGDRVAIYLQNDAQFVFGLLATWKLAAVVVPVNPMLRAPELLHVFGDSQPVALIARRELLDTCADPAASTGIAHIYITSGASSGVPSVPEPLPGHGRPGTGPAPRPAADDPAFLVYTSGTTGVPKAAVNTHANVLHSVEVFHRWLRIRPDDVILGAAPLFHITGLVAGIALGHRSVAPLVLFHRFDAATCLEHIARWRATTTVMAITAYIALMEHPSFDRTDVSSLTKVFSGGAAVPAAVAARWERATGSAIRNVYGLTETTSPTHMVPLSSEGRIDEATGAVAVGVPVPGAEVRVVDPDTGADVVAGEPGELVVRGPMVVPRYWNRDVPVADPVDGYFRTGDIGVMDADGWTYVIDRLKDMINASGFKVWPREVEDVLRQHPAVSDAAVVGVADEYRGETVKGYVTLRAGCTVTPTELIEYCRGLMAAYKYPRAVEIRDELPTSAAGKVLRRELRDAAAE